jgi:hypothetical protein
MIHLKDELLRCLLVVPLSFPKLCALPEIMIVFSGVGLVIMGSLKKP